MPQDAGHTFDRYAVAQLAKTVREQQREIISLQRALGTGGVKRHQGAYKPAIVYAAKTGVSGIPAAGGISAGSATLSLFRLSADGTFTATGETRTVYNITTAPIAGNIWIPVAEELLSNRLIAATAGNGVRTVRTVTVSGSYPPQASCPNTYGFRFTTVVFVETPGRQTPTVTVLSEGGILHNLFNGEDSYLPVSTDLWAFQSNGQWFTYARYDETDCQSESSSSASGESSSSESSQSLSSQSSSASSSSSSEGFSSSSSSSSEGFSSSSSSSSEGFSSSSSSQSDSSSSVACLDEFPANVADIPGYNGGNRQFLSHNAGCLEWIDAEPCDE